MPDRQDQRYLFVHVMKTGGTSFADILRSNFSPEQRYPDVVMTPDSNMLQRMEAYMYVPGLVAAVNARPDLRIVRGHMPYSVRSLLHGDFRVMTILRDPVERTVSYLKHCRRYHREHKGIDIEEIYEQRWFYESFIHNYQTKIFSMSAAEAVEETRLGDLSPPLPPRSAFVEGREFPPEAERLRQEDPDRFTLELFAASTGVIEVDRERLEVAKANLRSVDLVGTNDRYDAFLGQLAARYGWNTRIRPRRNVGESLDVSQQFRARIASDNALDMELYDLARSLAA